MTNTNSNTYINQIDFREAEIRVLNWMQQHNVKHPGDRITVQADTVLDAPAARATICSVEPFGYYVHIDGDGDDPEWVGPVDFKGNVLQEF